MSGRPPRIFIADDQRDVLESLRLLLKGEGYAIETYERPDALLEALRRRSADVVLIDLNYTRDTTSGEEGLDLIGRIRAFDATTPIVVMTAWGSIELAVEATRRGAGFHREALGERAPPDRAQDAGRARPGAQALERARGREPAIDGRGQPLIAESPVMQPVLETIERIAPSDANVLITGESGTGKGLIARIVLPLG